MKWLAAVFVGLVGVVVIVVMYHRYKLIKRRRQITSYENMGKA